MPRAGGIYNLPPGFLAVTGQKVLASQHNPPLLDIAQALTDSLPRDGTAPMVANLPMAGFRLTGLGAGTATTDAATVGQAREIGVPIGTVHEFFGTQIPNGYLLCYGQEVSRSDFADLFAVIGTAGGAGNGTTTFNIPDFRGRVAAGKDNMGGTSANRLTTGGSGLNGVTLGAAGGAETHTLTTPQTPAHTHSGTTSTTGAHFHTIPGNATSSSSGGNRPSGSGGSSVTNTSTAGNHSHTFTTSSVGGDEPHNNVQPTMIVSKIIKAFHP